MSRVGKRDMMARFGATLKNVRWSWDGVRGDGSVVFIGWEDEAIRAPDGTFAEYRLTRSLLPQKRQPGAAERIAHIEQLLAEEAAGYLVLASARDPTAKPRQIAHMDERLYTVRLERRGDMVFAVSVAVNSAPQASGEDADGSDVLIEESISPTEKQQLISARRGQGLFRARVELIEHGCRLTGVDDRAHLRAGHIKPWRFATNPERLDGNNGLLLAPHVDHLFDRGFLTFNNDGSLLVSSQLDVAILDAWGLNPASSCGQFNTRQQTYLEFHRLNIFRSPGHDLSRSLGRL